MSTGFSILEDVVTVYGSNASQILPIPLTTRTTINDLIMAAATTWRLNSATIGVRLKEFNQNGKIIPRSYLVRFVSIKRSPTFQVVQITNQNGNLPQSPRTVLIALENDQGVRIKEPISNSISLWEMLVYFEKKNENLNLVNRYQIIPKVLIKNQSIFSKIKSLKNKKNKKKQNNNNNNKEELLLSSSSSNSLQQQKSDCVVDKSSLEKNDDKTNYLIPILFFMTQQINETVEELKIFTLASLGITDNALLRLEYLQQSCLVKINSFNDNNNNNKTLSNSDCSKVEKVLIQTPPIEEIISKQIKVKSKEDIKLNNDKLKDNNLLSKNDKNQILDRELIFYAPKEEKDDKTNLSNEEEEESLNARDLLYYYGQDQKRRKEIENKGFTSKKNREIELEEEKKKKFPFTRICVKFHDYYKLEFTVLSSEKVTIIEEIFKSALSRIPNNDNLSLNLPNHPFLKLPTNGTVWEANLGPRSLLLCSEKTEPTLSYIREDLLIRDSSLNLKD